MSKSDNLLRFFDDMPHDWSFVVVELIDALREYIRTNEEIDLDAKIEGWDVTPEQWRKSAMHMQTVKLLLQELESYEVGVGLIGIDK